MDALLIKTEKYEALIPLQNVREIRKRNEKREVELSITFLDNTCDWFLGEEGEKVWDALMRHGVAQQQYVEEPGWQKVIEVNLCGSGEAAAGEVAGGAVGLTEEPEFPMQAKYSVNDIERLRFSRCVCGHFLHDHVGGMDCSLCSCELFEAGPDIHHRCKCNLVLDDKEGVE